MDDDSLDLLAIAAHRDDAEQTCGGTLLKMAQRGYRTGILDLTRGEMGSRGTPEERTREAAVAAKILRVCFRQALDIPDGRVENSWENRLKIARVIRHKRPQVVILPYWQGRHPDHYTCSILGYEACFLAGLAKLQFEKAAASAMSTQSEWPNRPHRPFKIIYATLYHDVRPTFVVDITDQFEARLESIYAYKSQYADQEAGKRDFPAHGEVRERVTTLALFYGMLAGVRYGEPFVQKEVGLVDDVTMIPVKSI